MADKWLGKVRGHVGEAKGRFDTDRREREAAGSAPADKNIILTEREVRGEWDASRVLFTTLGGQPRPITAEDLAAFRHNMRQAERRFKGGKGITARQVIDMASATPLRYISPGQPRSDIDKARREITMGVPVSAINGTIRFLTNSGPDSKVSRHHVVVNLHEFEAAAAQLAATPNDGKGGKSPKQIANWLRKQKLSFDCDCERHRYFFRYVATIGGFAAGRKETGYPKIRNPKLVGVACKHVLRVMTELESSNAVLAFLEKHLASVSEYKARTQLAQIEAEEAATPKAPTRIKTSKQRAAEAQKAREKAALARAAKEAATKPPKKIASASRRASKTAAETLAKQFGLSPEQVMKVLAAEAKKG
ncbi:hypothetical protein AB6N01_19560 [Alcaligenes nematophilus]|uniref:hypothetical protein n=1 Tax=Alcaligenes nematophilus TaxID=2994643 RepID=UPI0034E0CD4A